MSRAWTDQLPGGPGHLRREGMWQIDKLGSHCCCCYFLFCPGCGLPQRPVDLGRRPQADDGRGGGPRPLPHLHLHRPPWRGPQQQPVRQLLRRRRTIVLVTAAAVRARGRRWGPRGAGACAWVAGGGGGGVAGGVVWGRLGCRAAVAERAVRRGVRWGRVRAAARPDAPGAGGCGLWCWLLWSTAMTWWAGYA